MRMIRTCAVDECNGPVAGKGYCQKHYQRLRRHGDPLKLAINRRPSDPLKPCKVDGCQRFSEARGMCKSHWSRWSRTGDPGPAEFIHAPRSEGDEHRDCSKCDNTLPVEKFPVDPRYRTKRLSICYSCKAILDRDRAIARRYGITGEEYQQMLKDQGGRCATCGKDDVRLVVDHCHQTMKVRGILCDRCNVALGAAEDSEDTLLAMVAYLRSSRTT